MQCSETTSTLTELPRGAQEEEEERKDTSLTPQGQPSRRRLAAARARKVLLSATGCTASPEMRAKALRAPFALHVTHALLFPISCLNGMD